MRNSKVRVLVVGQTPPPFHGQAIMIERLVRGCYRRIDIEHVRLAFSNEIADVGAFRPGKVAHLAEVIARIAAARLRFAPNVLYYPPAGPHRIPVLRDLAILLATRRLFSHTVFHFHAGGLSELLPGLPPLAASLFRRAYFGADLAILPAAENPPDGQRLGARRTAIVPHGIEDAHPRFAGEPRGGGDTPRILFVGALRRSKGVLDLLEAARLLRDRGRWFDTALVGPFTSPAFEDEARGFVSTHGLADRVSFLGELTGDAKWRAFCSADILSFPTYYEAETFGLVVLEAMQLGLPVVATRWRGVSSLVRHGDTGLLVEPRDPPALATALDRLLSSPAERRAMGEKGRAVFLAEHTVERWYERMEDLLVSVGRSP